MKATPSQLSTRYLPFLVVAAVLCALVVFSPSKGRTTTVDTAAGDFSGEEGTFDSGTSRAGAGGGTGGFDDLDLSGGDGTGFDGAGTGGPGGTGGTGGGGGGEAGGDAAGGGPAGGVAAEDPGDRSRCDENGMQKAPYPTGVECRPVFGGDNGGATMNGVTGDEVRYLWYNPPSNAVIDGIMAGAGYARESRPFCNTMAAYEASAQKYYEMSGRTLVSLDGPGNNAGSRSCGGTYKFWQSTCPSDRPDPACLRAEAKTIAEQLRPAFVLNPRGMTVLHEELARYGIFSLGYAGARERMQQFAPYLWGTGHGSERLAGLHSEYYCARLVGKPPAFAGNDVQALASVRKVGLIYPETDDGALKPAIDLWLRTVRGCGDSEARTYSYQIDVARAQQQASSIVAQMRADGITTVGYCCEPVSMVFFMTAMNQSRYEPEHLILPASSIASDVVGQLAQQLGFGNQWRHAFGISNYPINQPDRDGEYRRVYADGGGPGGAQGAAPIEIESWNVFKPMMQMIHAGGARLTPRSIFDGMQALPPVAPSPRSTGANYGAPDPFSPLRDVAEIWWNPNLRSYYNDQQGAHCYVNGAQRYDLGTIPSIGGQPPLFGSNADCTRLPEYE